MVGLLKGSEVARFALPAPEVTQAPAPSPEKRPSAAAPAAAPAPEDVIIVPPPTDVPEVPTTAVDQPAPTVNQPTEEQERQGTLPESVAGPAEALPAEAGSEEPSQTTTVCDETISCLVMLLLSLS